MIQDYIRDETKNLRQELLRAQEEVKRIQSVPLVIGQFLEAVDERRGIVGSTTGAYHSFEGVLTNRLQLCRAHSLHP